MYFSVYLEWVNVYIKEKGKKIKTGRVQSDGMKGLKLYKKRRGKTPMIDQR